MAFFDIQSLFTNIPLDQAIDICVERVFQHKKKIKCMLKRHFKQLLTLIVKSSCFVFNNMYHKQTDGVTMGPLIVPTFANLLLVYYENMCLDKCPLQFKLKYYRRYVNDIFWCVKRKIIWGSFWRIWTFVIKMLNLHLRRNTIIKSYFCTNQKLELEMGYKYLNFKRKHLVVYI